ncbi:pancreatic triacylglycerol lipase-like [Xenopus laevis]|uniref:Pancreatic triacylglycerol lipase-like n=1 Tax=Xenopus laevis TaxID=8355 RepID=A0A8J1LCB5_XENLA|nr:pancreatic triacylglycerol lipase-like [Xenopus laevis]
MSLDSLFEYILLTEQQASEMNRHLPEGLDPAEPCFQNTPPEVRLDISDAALVDVIHTDAGPFIPDLGFGMSQVIGHLDFFPNGGVHMPGCTQNVEVPDVTVEDVWSGGIDFLTCNHERAVKYYTDSITSSNTFVSFPCTNWETYELAVPDAQGWVTMQTHTMALPLPAKSSISPPLKSSSCHSYICTNHSSN